MYKNIDEYKNIMRYFYAWLTLFVCSFYYNKYKTIFCSTTPALYYFMNMNKKIALISLFKNVYNWVKTYLIIYINSYIQK